MSTMSSTTSFGMPLACSLKVIWAYAIRPSSLTWGSVISPTPSIRPISARAGSIRDVTAASRAEPSSTFHTTVSVSPAVSGKAFSIRSYALLESVSGKEKTFA